MNKALTVRSWELTGQVDDKVKDCLKDGPFPASLSLISSYLLEDKLLPISGLKLRISGVRSDHSTN